MRKFTYKGFTLIELLIVIAVLGILSTMMMFSSTEAVTTAKVANIVNNLHHIKSAALDMFIDYDNFFNEMDKDGNPKNKPSMTKTQVSKGKKHDVRPVVEYMSKGGTDFPEMKNYNIVVGDQNGNKGSWYVVYEIKAPNRTEERQIKSKLAGRQPSIGLLGMQDATTAPLSKDKYTNQNFVALKIR